MISRAKAAATAGLDSIFVGDHHNVPMPYYQNIPIMGRLLAEWDSRDAGVLMLLPLWNPVLAAEQVATLASIAEGKFIMQCGLGSGARQFTAMGTNIKYRPSAFEQSLDCMRALWSGETVSLDGRWKFSGAKIAPLPPSKIEVWIGASAPVAIDRAARMGDVWLADPGMLLKQAGIAINVYQAALARHNITTPETIAIRRDVYVAESGEDAAKVREELSKGGYRGFDPEALIIGTPIDVAAQFQSFEKLGYTDIIIRNCHSAAEKALASTARLANVKNLLT
jgi:alkanesulfonate monooxygenase SsuD/methylene tetrahydromethanopterin reductase-like flavin-dependent oxidoreductase (luciferase family)